MGRKVDYPLRYSNGHIIMTVAGDDWLIDTGSPLSFGEMELVLDDGARQLPTGFMGIGAEFLGENIGLPLSGLVGTDILNGYEVIFDLPRGVIRLNTKIEALAGSEIPIELCLGVPVCGLRINGSDMKGFFDTGAQVSYAPAGILRAEDRIGTFQDFYPTQGAFEANLHWMELMLGENIFRIRCGTLPGFLAGMMNMAGAKCIIGNEILLEHQTGYFPRRGVLVIG